MNGLRKQDRQGVSSAVKCLEDAPRLPDRKIYGLAMSVLKPYTTKRYRVSIKNNGVTKGETPYVLLCNHCSTLDWIYVGMTYWPDLLNVVVTTYHYSNPKLRGLLRRAGAIAKDQFSPDVHSIKMMLKTAKLGGNIMLFPEGRTTPSGKSETFERSTVKLLRHLGLPVMGMHLYGAYLTNPKWSKTMRRGRVEIEMFPVFTPEELKSLSEDEIYERMCDVLRTDEFEWQDKNRVAYKGRKFARGLEYVLYKCPQCGAEFKMSTTDHELRCDACGNTVYVNEYYDLIPAEGSKALPNIGEWYEWEVAELRRSIEADPDIFLEDHILLKQITDARKWIEPVGEGEARADREGFHYVGTRGGEPYELHIPINMLPAVAVGPGTSFELYYQGEFFSFHPRDIATTQRWSMFIEQMHDYIESTEK